VTSALRDVPAVGRPTGPDAIYLSVALVAVSTSGPLIAAIAAPALAIAFWRNAMASAVLLPAVLLRRRDELRGLDRRERRLIGWAGLFLALHFATWVPAARLTSVATATALVATQPVWAALLSRYQGVPVSRRVWLGIGLSVAGALLLTGIDLRGDRDALIGDGLALLGGVFAALYVAAGSEVRRSVSTTTYTALCYSATSLLLLVVCVVGGQSLVGYDSTAWLQLVALTVGAQLLGHSLFNLVLRSTSPTVVSLSILLEIPGAALVAAIFLSQGVPLLALPAAVLLLAGLAVVIRSSSREVEPAVPVE
jgi:drug/metabolite transporter (DMT)-like permease